MMAHFVREMKLDEFWEVDRSWCGSNRAPPTAAAKRNEPKPLRKALPATVEDFVADHIEKGRHVNQHRIKCKGGESPEEQAILVSKAFIKPMEINEWKEESDGMIHMQCRRLEFTDIRFRMGDRVIDSWMQTSATTKQKKKLASVLFEQRVSLKAMGIDDEGVKVHDMTPFDDIY
jgi:hypothetical protein